MSIQNNFSSIQQMVGQINNSQPVKKAGNLQSTKPSGSLSFQEIFQQTAGAKNEEGTTPLKFSKHANERLQSRNIDLSQHQLERLESGTQRAREKGINESLVMVDNLAFIVNVKNNTVVTAVNDTDQGVFTNIDGAVIS